MGFIDKVLKGFLGDKNQTDLKEVKKVVAKIKTVEPAIAELSDDGLRGKTVEFKEKISEEMQKVAMAYKVFKEIQFTHHENLEMFKN